MNTDRLPVILQGKATTPEEGCWEWLRCKNPAGYGQVRINCKAWLAHRYVYNTCIAAIPDELIVMHTCDNPGCIRPSHLKLGTHYHNVQDKVEKGRGTAGEANGQAKLSDGEVIEIRKLYLEGRTQSELGRKYSVNRSCIWKIVNNTHRRNIL